MKTLNRKKPKSYKSKIKRLQKKPIKLVLLVSNMSIERNSLVLHYVYL